MTSSSDPDGAIAWRRAGALRGGDAAMAYEAWPVGQYARWASGYGGVHGSEVRSGAAWRSGLSVPAARGVVLLCHAGRDAPSFTDRDAVVLCPGPDIPGALAAGRA